MSLITYADLSQHEKDIVEEVKRLNDYEDEPRFSDDQYSSMLLFVINDINVCQPQTSYSQGGTPYAWRPLILKGMEVEFVKRMSRQYIEIPDLVNVHGTYANIRDFNTRWKELADSLEAEYQVEKKKMKIAMHMPGTRVTVDNYAYGLPPSGPVISRPPNWHPS